MYILTKKDVTIISVDLAFKVKSLLSFKLDDVVCQKSDIFIYYMS